MKKSILSIIFVLIAIFPSFSQDYIPFPDSSARWSVEWESFYSNIFDYTTYTGVYYELGGDTIVGELQYAKVFRKETYRIRIEKGYDEDGWYITETRSNCSDCPITLVGGIREDSLKKVYFVFFADNFFSLYQDIDHEVLLYDFSVEVGDTVHLNYSLNDCEQYYWVEEVDTITLRDSIPRKRIKVSSSNYCTYIGPNFNEWVEGVGDTNKGLFGSLFWYAGSFESWSDNNGLKCFKKDDEYLIGGEDGFCDSVIVVSIDKNPDILPDKINVFPNPAGSVVNISHTSGTIKTLKVFNILGKEIYAAKSREKTVPLDVTGWESGIYFVVVNGQYSARFVVR